MGEWRRVRLGDVAAEVTVGHVGSMANEYRDEGVPFLRSQNVLPHRIDLVDTKFIDAEFHARLKKSALRPGDVVTVRTGKPGTSAVVPDWMEVGNCADLVITRPGPELDSKWLSYYLNYVTDVDIAQRLVGAVQQHFNVGSAKALVLHMPELAEQKAIAGVLGVIEDKIAANKQIDISARALAKALVQRVQTTVPLSALCNQSTASLKPAEFDTTVAHFSLPAFDLNAGPEMADSAAIKSNKFILTSPCVLFSKLNPRIARVWNVSSIPPQMALASTEFVVLAPSTVSSSALWAAVAQPDVSASLQQMVAGTSGSHQRILPSALMSMQVRDVRTLPLEGLQLLEDIGQLCYAYGLETRRLEQGRDALLPLLMSGKLTVKTAESLVEEVI